MQSIELEAIITESHEIHLQLSDDDELSVSFWLSDCHNLIDKSVRDAQCDLLTEIISSA